MLYLLGTGPGCGGCRTWWGINGEISALGTDTSFGPWLIWRIFCWACENVFVPKTNGWEIAAFAGIRGISISGAKGSPISSSNLQHTEKV